MLDVPAAPVDLIHVERWAAECHAHLSAAEARTAREEGAAMTIEQATSYAVDELVSGLESDVAEIS